MDGWEVAKVVLRIAYSNQRLDWKLLWMHILIHSIEVSLSLGKYSNVLFCYDQVISLYEGCASSAVSNYLSTLDMVLTMDLTNSLSTLLDVYVMEEH